MEHLQVSGPSVKAADKPTLLFGTSFDLQSVGYAAREFIIEAEARSFVECEKNNVALAHAQAIKLKNRSRYATRILVFEPADQSRSCGTAIVEWLNVTGGLHYPAEWVRTHRHLIRRGISWIGVAAQSAESDEDPVRETRPHSVGASDESPRHPGDAYAFDIFSQAGLLVKRGALTRAAPSCVLAVGASQSARFLTTYINLFDPWAKLFDGYMATGRHKSAATLQGASVGQSIVPICISPRVPVFVLQTETDPFGRMGSVEVRQSDSETFRLWEIAGAAHNDAYLMSAGIIDSGHLGIEEIARAYDPSKIIWVRPKFPMNASPSFHYVHQAALHHLEIWVREGRSPPPGAVLDCGAGGDAIARDQWGVAQGGVRTPWVDCPAWIYSGENDETGARESLAGRTIALSAETLGEFYPGGVEDYLARFEASLLQAIKAGHLLKEDAVENLLLARALNPLQSSSPSRVLSEAHAI